VGIGIRVETFAGPSAINPYFVGSMATPYIPDLLGGAQIYGLFDGLTADDPLFDAILGGAPSGAGVTLLRLDSGIGKYAFDFTGYDMLLLINPGTGALTDPMLGVDPNGGDTTFLVPLMTGGAETAALFGGPGPSVLSVLDPFAIFATLIPEGGTTFNIGYTVNGVLFTASLDGLHEGAPVFLVGQTSVPEPATLGLAVERVGARESRSAQLQALAPQLGDRIVQRRGVLAVHAFNADVVRAHLLAPCRDARDVRKLEQERLVVIGLDDRKQLIALAQRPGLGAGARGRYQGQGKLTAMRRCAPRAHTTRRRFTPFVSTSTSFASNSSTRLRRSLRTSSPAFTRASTCRGSRRRAGELG
jgi:hypothetical protein